MTRLKLGVALEALGLPLRPALDAAARLALDGVQLDAAGELGPDVLTGTGRRELRTLFRAHLLDLTAVNCPLRRGLDNPEQLQARLDHLRKVMQMTVDLGANKIIVPLPAVPAAADALSPRAVTMREALTALAAAGDKTGVLVAVEPGLDSGEAVREYLAGFDTGSLSVNYDPANFLAHGHDPLAALTALGPRLVHAHARDARRSVAGGARETPVGAGDIDWVLLLATMEAVDYRGTLTVDSETGASRPADVRAGVTFLRRFVPPPRR